jgi:ornithine cyclodeaminase/alanine dehydrogenase-like protein (mu-crystallin family)
VAAVRPIRTARVYSRTLANREQFAEEMADALGIEVQPVGTARKAVEGMDIVLVMTNTSEPVLFGGWLEPGQHVTSVMGGNLVRDDTGRPLASPRRDLDDRVIERSDVIVINSREQAEQDWQGDIMLPIESGILTWERVGELGELLAGQIPGRTSPEQITLYKNNAGQGVVDVALAALVVERARALGRGAEFS